jgi:hypothetical protein
MRRDETAAHAPDATISRRPILPALEAVTALTVILVSVFFANRGSAGPSHPSTTTSRGDPPPWMRVEPSLAGTWLHWREYEYYENPESPDPAIGKLLMADIWEHISTDNVPTLVHSRITFAANGQFYQEVYDSPTASITVQGTAYKSVYPTEVSLPETWCVQHWPLDPGRFRKLTPEFADEHGVQMAGFTLTTRGPLHAPPPRPRHPLQRGTSSQCRRNSSSGSSDRRCPRATWAPRPSRSMRMAAWSSRNGARGTRRERP